MAQVAGLPNGVPVSPAVQQFVRDLPGLWKLWSSDLHVVAVSNDLLRQCAIDRDQVVGRPAFEIARRDIADPQTISNLRAAATRVLSHAQTETHPVWVHTRADRQEPHYWSVQLSPLFGDQQTPQYVLVQIEDLTQFAAAGVDPRKVPPIDDLLRWYSRTFAALERVRVAEERFKLAAQASKVAIWDWDVAADAITWMEGFDALFGWSTADAVTTRDWAALIHDDDRAAAVESFRRAVLGFGTTWSAQYRLRRGDATWADVIARAFFIRDASGRAERAVGVVVDVTEQRRLEAQLLRAQRLESLGTLAGGIAHDLNNVLTPILMGVAMLRESCSDTEVLDMIDASAKRGAGVVQQVLAYGRGSEPNKRTLNLQTIIGEIHAIVSETFPRNIAIRVDRGEGIRLDGDATQLHQVLLNLCINARDAMPNGGTLTVAVEPVDIDAAYAAMTPGATPGHHAVLSVSDSGSGIPDQIRDRIFEPFFTTKPPGQGTGLGLSTVSAIVKGHGGFITVYSEPDRGTTFKVYLPTGEIRVTEAPEPVAAVAHDAGRVILVVDDETGVLGATSRVLKSQGYRVLTAVNGADGLDAFAEHADEIALVISDMMLPILDGQSMVQAIRAIRPQARIVATSGLVTPDLQAQCSHLSGFLPKPYNAESLLRAVQRALAN